MLSAAEAPTVTLAWGRFGSVSRIDSASSLDAVELDLHLLDPLAALLVGFEDVRGVKALPLVARDLVAGGVLLALEAFDLRNQTLAVRLDRRQLVELGTGIEPAREQALPDVVEVVADENGIKHCLSALF